MISDRFKQFDRELEDFRNDVAIAKNTINAAVQRYVAMLEALDTAFLLFYEDMPPDDKAKMKAAFDKLAGTVAYYDEKPADNIHVIREPKRVPE